MLIKTTDIIKEYPGPEKRGKKAVQALGTLEIPQGASVGLMGVSGAGKSTLGLIIAGLLRPDKGQVTYKGKSLAEYKKNQWRHMRQKIQVVFQHPETAFDPRWKIIKSLEEPYRIHGLAYRRDDIIAILEEMELSSNILSRFPAQLSGGELQRVAMARALCLLPELVILDESTSMLDALTQANILSLLKNSLDTRGTASLFISHNVHLVRTFCSKAYSLENGRLSLHEQEKNL